MRTVWLALWSTVVVACRSSPDQLESPEGAEVTEVAGNPFAKDPSLQDDWRAAEAREHRSEVGVQDEGAIWQQIAWQKPLESKLAPNEIARVDLVVDRPGRALARVSWFGQSTIRLVIVDGERPIARSAGRRTGKAVGVATASGLVRSTRLAVTVTNTGSVPIETELLAGVLPENP